MSIMNLWSFQEMGTFPRPGSYFCKPCFWAVQPEFVALSVARIITTRREAQTKARMQCHLSSPTHHQPPATKVPPRKHRRCTDDTHHLKIVHIAMPASRPGKRQLLKYILDRRKSKAYKNTVLHVVLYNRRTLMGVKNKDKTSSHSETGSFMGYR